MYIYCMSAMGHMMIIARVCIRSKKHESMYSHDDQSTSSGFSDLVWKSLNFLWNMYLLYKFDIQIYNDVSKQNSRISEWFLDFSICTFAPHCRFTSMYSKRISSVTIIVLLMVHKKPD